MASFHPRYVQFYPTLRCNRRCSFCFNRGLPVMDDVGIDRFTEMAALLSDDGVEEIDILGGEPTLHREIVGLVDAACAKGLKVLMSTNGTGVSVMEEIIGTFGSSCFLGISINEERISSDLDSFLSRQRPAVKSLFKGGIEKDRLVESLFSKGIRKHYLLYPDIISGNREDSFPFFLFYEDIAKIGKRFSHVEPVYCSGFLPDPAYPELLDSRCSAGVTKLGIMPDGSVFPCNLLFGVEEFLLGNIFTDGLGKIWKSPRLDFFRRFKGNRCSVNHCPLRNECHGGCPAHALRFYGSLDGPEPRCAIRESVGE